MNKKSYKAASASNTRKDIDVECEKNDLNYRSKISSLQHMSAVKIITILWTKTDIQRKMKIWSKNGANYIYSEDMVEIICEKTKIEMLDKVSQLTKFEPIRNILENDIIPVGQEIFDWMQYHDKHIFPNSVWECWENSTAVNYLDNLVWIKGINYKQTARKLIANEHLPRNIKYNIACVYCFEEDIVNILPHVIFKIDLLEFDRQAMVHFWTAYVTGNFTKLIKEVANYNEKYDTCCSVNECIFQIIVGFHETLCWHNRVSFKNQVAIKFMWDKLTNDEKSRLIVPAINITSSADIKYFLLSQLNEEQEKEVFDDDTHTILLSILNDWSCEQYFLALVHHKWDILSINSFVYVLKGVGAKIVKNRADVEKHNKYKDIFKELWQCSPEHLKDSYFESCVGSKHFFELLDQKYLDLIQFMLKNCTEKQRKSIIKSDDGITRCVFYIISNQWDLIEVLLGKSFIKTILFQEESTEKFESMLLKRKEHCESLQFEFIQNKTMVEEFLIWALGSLDRNKLLSSIIEILLPNEICQDYVISLLPTSCYSELESFFMWCSYNYDINNLKIKLSEHSLDKVICKLIKENKYELLDQFLNWGYGIEVYNIKQQIFYIIDGRVDLLLHFIKSNDQLKSLEKFISYFCCNWLNTPEDGIGMFKKRMSEIKYHTGRRLNICLIDFLCIEFLSGCMFETANEIIFWCCNSLQAYKNKLIRNKSTLSYLFQNCLLLENYKKILAEIFEWFNLSPQDIIHFKETYKDCWWFEDVIKCVRA